MYRHPPYFHFQEHCAIILVQLTLRAERHRHFLDISVCPIIGEEFNCTLFLERGFNFFLLTHLEHLISTNNKFTKPRIHGQ